MSLAGFISELIFGEPIRIQYEKVDLNLPKLTLKNSPHSDDDGNYNNLANFTQLESAANQVWPDKVYAKGHSCVYYKYFSESKSWSEADAVCKSIRADANLAQVWNEREIRKLRDLIKNGKAIWLDGFTINDDDRYWKSGSRSKINKQVLWSNQMLNDEQFLNRDHSNEEADKINLLSEQGNGLYKSGRYAIIYDWFGFLSMIHGYNSGKYPHNFVCEARCDVSTGILPEAPVVSTVAGGIDTTTAVNDDVFDYYEGSELGSGLEESTSTSVSTTPVWDSYYDLYPERSTAKTVVSDGSEPAVEYPDDLESNWDHVPGTSVYFKKIEEKSDGSSASVHYSAAEAICKELSPYATLATINDQNEFDFIMEEVLQYFGVVWTSLTGSSNKEDRGKRAKWFFSNGHLAQENWWIGNVDGNGARPLAGYEQNACFIIYDGEYTGVSNWCFGANYPLCEIRVNSNQKSNFAPITSSSLKYIFYPYEKSGNLTFAVDYCKSKGQQIATIRNEEEHQIITKQLDEYYHHKPFYWLGAKVAADVEAPHRERFYWLDSDGNLDLNKPVHKTFSKWHPGEPNNAQNWIEIPIEHCVHLCSREAGWCRDGSWNDVYCGREDGGVVCEERTL